MAGPDRGGRSRGAAGVRDRAEAALSARRGRRAAAAKAAEAARDRTAEYLLAARLEQLREQAAARTETAAAAPWRDRLAEVAARPLDEDTAGTVRA
ncbi:hypothetical protein AB0B21_35270 [Streptomyces rimosus]|uniref:hypothetical protein n=1 Tax=Streptomyces rimosus TaxID=1927 RepID=UPI001F1FC609|nr:hypothetical protein [Streptomyces rimosus]